MTVEVTQFLRPHGRQNQISTEMANDLAPQYRAILDSGCRLTAEVLATGLVSMTVEDPALGDFDIFVCSNGPAVLTNLEAMIRRFNLDKLQAWRANRA